MISAAPSTDQLCVNVLRGLAIDAVQKANSGHPGLPLGAMPMAYALWQRHLKINPQSPAWFDRDRFILSAGHGSALQYALMHLAGFDLSLDDLRNFRQWGSKTPGHPENFMTSGVEMTTGPLGQGIATSVGFAIAERYLAARYNRDGHRVVDHHTYALCSDGDLMEGVGQEAASLAGHLGLGKLIWLYDDNQITIDGSTSLSFTEDTRLKFEAMGWHVQEVDGMDVEAVDVAIAAAKSEADRPSLIACRTVIGYGSPNKAGTSKVHGSPLGADELKLTKEALGLPAEEFWCPDEARAAMAGIGARGAAAEAAWEETRQAYRNAFAAEAAEFDRIVRNDFGLEWQSLAPSFEEKAATRKIGPKFFGAISEAMPTLLSGCADLAESVFTEIPGGGSQQANNPAGRNLNYGVREHAMVAALNGITLHGGCKAVGGTFLIFSDYCKPALRLAALMGSPSIVLFSHDSIGLGEDGPTHQPVEHMVALRAIPNFNVMRPADLNEASACLRIALESDKTPSAIVTSRQDLPLVTPRQTTDHPAKHGGYVLREPSSTPQITLVATGSEIALALDAAEQLESEGIPTRVVNLVSWHLFEQQSAEYRASVLDRRVPTVSIEAASTMGWSRYADEHIGLDRFGASAPGPFLMKQFGFTVENVVARAKALLARP